MLCQLGKPCLGSEKKNSYPAYPTHLADRACQRRFEHEIMCGHEPNTRGNGGKWVLKCIPSSVDSCHARISKRMSEGQTLQKGLVPGGRPYQNTEPKVWWLRDGGLMPLHFRDRARPVDTAAGRENTATGSNHPTQETVFPDQETQPSIKYSRALYCP